MNCDNARACKAMITYSSNIIVNEFLSACEYNIFHSSIAFSIQSILLIAGRSVVCGTVNREMC